MPDLPGWLASAAAAFAPRCTNFQSARGSRTWAKTGRCAGDTGADECKSAATDATAHDDRSNRHARDRDRARADQAAAAAGLSGVSSGNGWGTDKAASTFCIASSTASAALSHEK